MCLSNSRHILETDKDSLLSLLVAFAYAAEEAKRRNDSCSTLTHVGWQPQVVKPLLLVLLQLCTKLLPSLGIMEWCMFAMYRIICASFDYLRLPAAAETEAAPAAEAQPAAAQEESDALSFLLQPLFCTMGPAVARAAMKPDLGWSKHNDRLFPEDMSLQERTERAVRRVHFYYGEIMLQTVFAYGADGVSTAELMYELAYPAFTWMYLIV
jgi:hypothetical protein